MYVYIMVLATLLAVCGVLFSYKRLLKKITVENFKKQSIKYFFSIGLTEIIPTGLMALSLFFLIIQSKRFESGIPLLVISIIWVIGIASIHLMYLDKKVKREPEQYYVIIKSSRNISWLLMSSFPLLSLIMLLKFG